MKDKVMLFATLYKDDPTYDYGHGCIRYHWQDMGDGCKSTNIVCTGVFSEATLKERVPAPLRIYDISACPLWTVTKIFIKEHDPTFGNFSMEQYFKIIEAQGGIRLQ